MAGTNFEILNPGYSILWVRDLPYTPGSGDDSDTNPLNPNDDRALVEGEWLQYSSSDGSKLTRGGDNVVTVSGTPDGEGTVPAYPFWLEKGRYDMQFKRLCHVLLGPHGFEFRTRLIRTSGLSVNDAVAVFDWDGESGAFGLVRRTLAKQSAGYVVGRVSRIFGTNDASVYFMPGSSS